MLYNENIAYNQPGSTYVGGLVIYVPELSSPIVLNNIIIFFGENVDNSNSTSIGIVTISSIAESSISIEASPMQASALVGASKININQYSEISIEY
jgi:hypothetical protein